MTAHAAFDKAAHYFGIRMIHIPVRAHEREWEEPVLAISTPTMTARMAMCMCIAVDRRVLFRSIPRPLLSTHAMLLAPSRATQS